MAKLNTGAVIQKWRVKNGKKVREWHACINSGQQVNVQEKSRRRKLKENRSSVNLGWGRLKQANSG